MADKTVTIVGQGYVGLPLAEAASAAGWKVYGLDTSSTTVAALSHGRSHVDDLSDTDISVMLTNGYQPTTDISCIADSNLVVVCVPTPLGDAGAPDLASVRSAAVTVGRNLQRGTTVVLESTTYPGTTEEEFLPILEQESGLQEGEDFFVAFSPERVDPGNKSFGISNTPKLVGGTSPQATSRATSFYSDFVDEVVPLSGTREAEMAKLLENTFRHVNIALVNEMAKFSRELGIDIHEVIRGAATKPFGFMKFTPGPGVGGHCIPIDPNYLSYEVRKELGYPFRFVELAQEINNSMPSYVVSRVGDILNEASKPVRGANILLLGVTYKPNIGDLRESPALNIIRLLKAKGADVRYHDPSVGDFNIDGERFSSVECLEHATRAADLVVILQPHAEYDLESLTGLASATLNTSSIPLDAHRL